MLTTGMIGGPSIVFCRHAEAGVSKIRSHIYSEADAKTCRSVLGLDSNSLYLFCSGQEMPCGKEKVFKCNPGEKAERAKQDEIIQNVLNDKLFGFFEVDIEVPEQKRKRFSEFCPLFVISEVPEDQIPQHMKDYKINTGRKMIKNNKKLLGVMKAEKILLYSPLLKCYLNHGLQVTKFTDIYLIHPADLSNGFQKKFQVQEETLTTIKTKSNSVIQLNLKETVFTEK